MSQIVGIDLGTTNSLCAIFRDGNPKLIPNPHGDVLTPSVVGVLDDGRVLVGVPARELRVTRPDRCCSMFKRYMGSDRKLTLGKKTFSATELSSLVLRSLKEDAEVFLGEPVSEAVITVPAYFNDLQRKATRQAGEIAGFKVRRIVNEPTAAALTYGFHDRNADKKLIVIDLGGGTFDVTLLEVFEGTLEIVGTAGESFLGGEDFTDRLAANVLQQVGLHLESVEGNSPLLISRLRQECELAKRKLGTDANVSIRVPDKQGGFGVDEKKIDVSREDFAKLVQPLVERVKGPIGKVLRDASCPPETIEEVILVGGATRMPVVKEMIAKYFEREPLTRFNPDEVVALGAAVQAALISDDAAVDDMVMTDVCPFTLGIEVIKSFGRRKEDGYYSPIIHRNTTIPVSREEMFNTVDNNQTEVLVSVFQGESRHVKDNLKLGELRVTGIPPGPAGQSFCVRFTYDLNGILEVEAYVPQTRKKFNTVLKNHARDLSPDEIKEAVERMQGLKFYPRDDVANQRLVLFVERMVGEVSPHQREQLEGALDYFEAAMSSGDRTMFQSAREELMIVLANLGMHYEGDDAR